MDLTQINALLSGIMGGSPQAPVDPGQAELNEQAAAQPEASRSFEAPSSVNLGLPASIADEIARYTQRRQSIDDLLERSRSVLNTDPRENREAEFKKTWAGKHPILSALHSVLVGAGGMPQASARNMAMQQIDADLNTKKQAAQQVLQTVLGEARINKSEYDTNLKQSNEQFNQWMKQQGLTQTDLKRQLEAQRLQINKELAEGRMDVTRQRLALDTLYKNAQIEALTNKSSIPTREEWAARMTQEGKWKQPQIDNWLGASDKKGAGTEPTYHLDPFGKLTSITTKKPPAGAVKPPPNTGGDNSRSQW